MSKKVIYCNCGGDIISDKVKETVSNFLYTEKVEATQLSDLCGLCVSDKGDIQKIFSSSEPTLIAACHPRAVKKLLDFAGVKSSFENIAFLNLRDTNETEIISLLKSFCNEEPSIQTEHFSEKECPHKSLS